MAGDWPASARSTLRATVDTSGQRTPSSGAEPGTIVGCAAA